MPSARLEFSRRFPNLVTSEMAEPREIELVFEPQEEGGYHVYAPGLPGLHTQRKNLDDASPSL